MDGSLQDPDVRSARRRNEFPIGQTHGIALWPQHEFRLDSSGLGWHGMYTSFARESSWNRTLGALPHLCLAYCARGVASITRSIDGKISDADTTLRPRLLGIVPEGRTSVWNLRGSPDIQLIYLRRSMVERVAHDVLDLEASAIELVPQLGFADALLEHLMIETLDAARGLDAADSALYADHLAETMAIHVLRRYGARTTQSATPAGWTSSPALSVRMRRVRDLIESALEEDLSLERLAREANVGAHAFSAAFLRAVGTTPHRYIVERRIERAKRLLRSGDLPLTDVALRSGFSDQSHLTTVFRRSVGVTPARYRRG